MNFTSNLTLLRAKEAFSLVIEFRAIQRPNLAVDDWQVVEAKAKMMVVRVTFPAPDEISLSTVRSLLLCLHNRTMIS